MKRQSPPLGNALPYVALYLLLLGLSGCALLPKVEKTPTPKDRSAVVLDASRQFHLAVCVDREPAPDLVGWCEWFEDVLVQNEPGLEDWFVAKRGWSKAWGVLRGLTEPVARGLVQGYLPWLVPVLWPAGRAEA